jgi:hypothetical protein
MFETQKSTTTSQQHLMESVNVKLKCVTLRHRHIGEVEVKLHPILTTPLDGKWAATHAGRWFPEK